MENKSACGKRQSPEDWHDVRMGEEDYNMPSGVTTQDEQLVHGPFGKDYHSGSTGNGIFMHHAQASSTCPAINVEGCTTLSGDLESWR